MSSPAKATDGGGGGFLSKIAAALKAGVGLRRGSKRDSGDAKLKLGDDEEDPDDDDEDGDESSSATVVRSSSPAEVRRVMYPERAKMIIDPAAMEDRDIDMSAISHMKLYDHQLRVVNHMMRPDVRGLVCAFPVGTGKTRTAVAVGAALLANGYVDSVLIVTPLSLRRMFQAELHDWLKGSEINRFELMTRDSFSNRVRRGGAGLCENRLLIIDEAHELKKKVPEAALMSERTGTALKPLPRSYDAITCAIRARKVLLLTATPYVAYKRDVLNLAAMIKGEAPLDDVPARDADAMRYFKDVFAFFEVGDAASRGIPLMTESRVEIIMNDAYYQSYYDVQRSSRVDFGKFPLVFLSGVRQATNALKTDMSGKPLVNAKVEWVRNRLLLGRKTVIYSAFITKGIDHIKASLAGRKIPFFEIRGKTTEDERALAVDEYNKSPNGVLFITKAGGLGLDLKRTRDVILLESSWTYSQERQVIGRAVRVNSHLGLPADQHTVEVFHLILKKPEARFDGDELESADERMQLLVEKRRLEEPTFIDMLKRVSVR